MAHAGSIWRRLFGLVVLLAGACPVVASGGSAIADDQALHRSYWAVKDGAPADIWAMAQGRDGYLWLGTGTGLYRFDGVRFEHMSSPGGHDLASSNITALNLLPDGSLWIGFYYGGISVLKDGASRRYGLAQGVPEASVLTFAADPAGALWAATTGGLLRFDGRAWHTVGADWNYPADRADWLLMDPAGTLWITTGRSLVFLRQGSHRFEGTGVAVGDYAMLARAPDGTLWLSDGLHGTRALPGLSAAHPQLARRDAPPTTSFARAKRMTFDRAGNLWVTQASAHGAYLVRDASRLADGRPLAPGDLTERFDQPGALTSDMAVPLLEDAEGDVWIGTNLGLNSFRPADVVPLQGVAMKPTTYSALSMDDRGVLWMVYEGALYRIEHGVPRKTMEGLPDVSDICAGPGGLLWYWGARGLERIRGGRIEAIPFPDGMTDGDISAMASDGADGLWIGLVNKGAYHYRDGIWQRWIGGDGLAGRAPTVIARQPDGVMWFGYVGGRLARKDGETVRVFGPDDGLRIGTVTAIDARSPQVLVGGDAGLARLGDGRFVSLAGGDDVLRGISGIVRTARHGVWLNTSRGVVRMRDAALEQALADPQRPPEYRLFDDHDGLTGVALQASAVTTAMQDADGQLWFATNQEVARIDPAHVHHNAIAPPVSIRGLTAGDRSYPATDGLRLPKRTSNVHIEYTATSLAVPGRVRFRYRLDGVDEQWQEAGDRREAFYTNLGPGDYHFRVIAANGDGVWNEQGASFRFRIPPLFYQTPWFAAACVLAALALVFALFLLRVRQMAIRVHDRLEERHAERERIARELHDTLLQAIQGLVLRFQAVAERIPADDPVRTMIDRSLDRADDVLVEGRDRVRGLRISAEAIRDLPNAFAAVGADLVGEGPPAFEVVVEGSVRTLDPIVREELYRIGHEALVNAIQHARADRIEVELDYDAAELRVRVRDDGIGIDAAILGAGGKPGHWGLPGMHERASRIGATLDIWSRPESGTEVELRVPASVAYCGGKPSWFAWLRHLVSGGRYA